MIHDDGWLELVEIFPALDIGTDWNEVLQAENSAIHIFCSNNRGGGDDDASIHALPLTSVVAEAFVSPGLGTRNKSGDYDATQKDTDECQNKKNLIRVHPLLFCFLHHASTTQSASESSLTTKMHEPMTSLSPSNVRECAGYAAGTDVDINPLPILEFQWFQSMWQPGSDPELSWKCQPVKIKPLEKNSQLFFSCIYIENPELFEVNNNEMSDNANKSYKMSMDEIILIGMEGRLVKQGSVVLLSTIYGYVIVLVAKIAQHGQSVDRSVPGIEWKEADMVYRLSDNVLGDYQCHLEDSPVLSGDKSNESFVSDEGIPLEHDVPGYELLVKEIMLLFRVHGDLAAASGIVVSGCAGVGKTRLASCVAHQHSNTQRDGHSKNAHGMVSNATSRSFGPKIYFSSVQDLIFQASVDSNLLENVLLPKLRGCEVWIIDDLHMLESDEGSGDEFQKDNETIMVQNALIEAIDRFHLECRILGLTQSVSRLSPELTKSGRLEKSLQMLQPTQLQRIEIWKSILADDRHDTSLLDVRDGGNDGWIVALASSTAGCVPRDMLRIYRDAKTKASASKRNNCSDENNNIGVRWEDLREAIKVAIPSQLSELDVIKPKVFPDGISWRDIHSQSWQDFAGYPILKKNVYRQVVVPWRFFLQSLDESITGEVESSEKSWLEPPPGVLFHGISGTGKSVAAKCLAVSLGLPIIQVRASDLLDKWLGGSEALLRSLFSRARAVSPCVLFLDEIDSIACNREEDDNSDVSSRILSTLLNEMDGVSSAIQKSRILVIACTNRIKSIDSALLRPGRLQEHFQMNNPSSSDLEDIINLRMGRIPKDESFDLKLLANLLFEYQATGADVEGLCREATFHAMRRVETSPNKNVKVTQEDFESAISERFGTTQGGQ